MKRCGRCGHPLRLSKGYVWPGNGTIFARNDPTLRMAIFEADYYSHVWSALEERLGVGMADTIIRGQGAAVQDYLQSNVPYGWRRALMRRLPLRYGFKRVVDEMSLFGFGRLEMMDYRRGEAMVVRVVNPFDMIYLALGIKGFFELVEGAGSRLAWTPEGEDYVLTISSLPRAVGSPGVDAEALLAVQEAKRELSAVETQLPGRGPQQERCAACGLPLVLDGLEWREREGTIYARQFERRFIFTSGYVFLGTVRDLERRTGADLERVVLEITKNYHLRRLQGIPEMSREDVYRSVAEHISAGGFGVVLDSTSGEGRLEMTIGNPFHLPRVVGRVAAAFEFVEGRGAEISYERTQPYLLKLEIKAA